MKKLLLIVICLATWMSSAQITLKGVVKDSIGNPLEMANVIAINKDTKKLDSYGFTDAKGNYKLNLKKNATYNIKASYIGLETADITVVTKEKDNNTFNLLHVSSLTDTHKNISGMLKVAKQLENKIGNFTWRFVGGESTQFNQLIKNLNFTKTNIEFINHISQEELVKYLQKTDLYISFSNYETFGIVMTEALSCGVPVISTNTGVLNELGPSEFYKIIAIKDEDALLKEILTFKNVSQKNDPSKMHDFVAKNYSKKAISKQFSEIYSKSLKA